MLSRLYRKLQAAVVRVQIGQSMIEYALIVALIAIVVIGTLTLLGSTIGDKFTKIQQTLSGAGG